MKKKSSCHFEICLFNQRRLRKELIQNIKEGLPNEYQYEFEQEMLKQVHDLKNDLREKGWWERETPEVSQTSFLRSENLDAELGFKFE